MVAIVNDQRRNEVVVTNLVDNFKHKVAINLQDKHMFVCFVQSIAFDTYGSISLIVIDSKSRDLERVVISLDGCLKSDALIKKDFIHYSVKDCWFFKD